MKYVYSIKRSPHLTPDQLREILPSEFLLREENNQMTIVIEVEDEISEEQIYYKIQRECDRIFFLTGIQLDPMFESLERPDGSRKVVSELPIIVCGVEPLPSDLDRQEWTQTQTLPLQLRLWQLAHMAHLPVSVQIILLYQIIEIENSNNSLLTKDAVKRPDSWEEAKLIRDWVSHQGARIKNQNLKNYLEKLGIKDKEKFFDPTNIEHQQIISKLHEKVEKGAEKIIASLITKKTTNA